jgi:hypothetical protein
MYKRLPDVVLIQMDERNLPYEAEFDVVAAFDGIGPTGSIAAAFTGGSNGPTEAKLLALIAQQYLLMPDTLVPNTVGRRS